MMRSVTGAAVLVLAWCLQVACSDDKPPVASVDVTPAADTVRAGLTVPLTATTRDANGAVLTGRTVTWDTDDPTIATVNNAGLVMGVDNGTVAITATSEGRIGAASVAVWVGTTGDWTGQVDAGGGGNFCALTQALTEDLAGAITGNGTLGGPCTAGPYTIVGNIDVGGVADSVVMSWSGTFALTLSGKFDGTSMMSGEVTGGGCGPGQCPFTFTRNSIVPPAPPSAGALRAAGQEPARGTAGVLGRAAPR